MAPGAWLASVTTSDTYVAPIAHVRGWAFDHDLIVAVFGRDELLPGGMEPKTHDTEQTQAGEVGKPWPFSSARGTPN